MFYHLSIIYKTLNGGFWPTKAHEDDAGLDLVANGNADGEWTPSGTCCCPENCPYHNPFIGRVYVGSTLKVKCGFKMAMPRGWEADVRPRSGLSTKFRILPANTPGTIDCGYRDEIAVVLMNLGSKPYDIFRGDKIAQMLFIPVPEVTATEGELPESHRGVGGFGSSGR